MSARSRKFLLFGVVFYSFHSSLDIWLRTGIRQTMDSDVGSTCSCLYCAWSVIPINHRHRLMFKLHESVFSTLVPRTGDAHLDRVFRVQFAVIFVYYL